MSVMDRPACNREITLIWRLRAAVQALRVMIQPLGWCCPCDGCLSVRELKPNGFVGQFIPFGSISPHTICPPLKKRNKNGRKGARLTIRHPPYITSALEIAAANNLFVRGRVQSLSGHINEVMPWRFWEARSRILNAHFHRHNALVLH